MRIIYAIFLVLLLSPGCAAIEEKDLYGTYTAKYPFGSEKLTLAKDGVYSQEVTATVDARTVVQRGRWRYKTSDRYVELENGLVLQNGFGVLNSNYAVPFDGLVLEKVSRSFPWSPVRLGADELIQLRKVSE